MIAYSRTVRTEQYIIPYISILLEQKLETATAQQYRIVQTLADLSHRRQLSTWYAFLLALII